MNRLLATLLVLLTALTCRGDIVGSIRDILGAPYKLDPVFRPLQTPLALGTNVVLGGTRKAITTNGSFRIMLMPGTYEAQFGDIATIKILVPDTNTVYTFVQTANLYTNLPAFIYTNNPYIDAAAAAAAVAFVTPTNFATFDESPVYLRTSMWLDGAMTNAAGLVLLWSYDLTNWANLRADYGYVWVDPTNAALSQLRDPTICWDESRLCFYVAATRGDANQYITATNDMYFIASPDLITWTNVLGGDGRWRPDPAQNRAMAPQFYRENNTNYCQYVGQSGIYACHSTDWKTWSTPVRIDHNTGLGGNPGNQWDAWVVKDGGIYKMLNTVPYGLGTNNSYNLVYSTNNGTGFEAGYYPVFTNLYGYENHAWVKKGTNWFVLHTPIGVYGRIRLGITNVFGYTPTIDSELILPEAYYPVRQRYYGARDLLPLTGVAKYRVLSAIDSGATKKPTAIYDSVDVALNAPLNEGSGMFFNDTGPARLVGGMNNGVVLGSTNVGWSWVNDPEWGWVFGQSQSNQYSATFEAGHLSGMTNFTAMCWVKLTNTIPNGYVAPIMGVWGWNILGSSEWEVRFAGTNMVADFYRTSGTYGTVYLTGTNSTPTDGNWHMVTLTYRVTSGTKATGTMYLDKSCIAVYTNFQVILPTYMPLIVGGRNSANSGAHLSPSPDKYSFPGRMRGVKVLRRELSLTEISDEYLRGTLGNITAASTNYLRGDGIWSAVASGSSTVTNAIYSVTSLPLNTTTIDLAGTSMQTMILTNNVTLALSNIGAGKNVSVLLYGTNNQWNVTVPTGARLLSGSLVNIVTTNKSCILNFSAFGNYVSNVVISVAIEP